MGHLLAALKQASFKTRGCSSAATACSSGVYMTKAVRRLIRQASTPEVNTPHQTRQNQVSSKQSENTEKLHLKWFGEFMNICVFLE